MKRKQQNVFIYEQISFLIQKQNVLLTYLYT